jgi:hypothetical protein
MISLRRHVNERVPHSKIVGCLVLVSYMRLPGERCIQLKTCGGKGGRSSEVGDVFFWWKRGEKRGGREEEGREEMG